MTIDQLLQEPGQEDKVQNLSTTSFQFKRDLWDFFSENFSHCHAVEFGTHKGQTTRIMAFLFDQVYTINRPVDDVFVEAKILNRDRDNINYIGFNLYGSGKLVIPNEVSMVFIDANHEYDNVMQDIERALGFRLSSEAFLVFDDYGSSAGVKIAVTDFVDEGKLQIVRTIGHGPAHSFGGRPERILQDFEGVICKVV